ncbi:MAG: peptidylprolyl isomerase [Candidatus Peregrinibacteria bacterium]|nr:peptidylprolyl isomerase [Candidatus Peregrinibacteria bacterium]
MYKFIIPLFALAFLLVSCNPAEQPNDGNPTGDDLLFGEENASSTSSVSAMESTSSQGNAMTEPQPSTGIHTVVMHTSKGDITLELNADSAPKTVGNFLALAEKGFYDGLTFHRVIDGFMIQGGDPSGDGTGGSDVTFEDEINAKSYGLDKQKLKDVAGNQQIPAGMENTTVEEFYELQGYQYNDALDSLPMTYGALAMANAGPNTNSSQFFIIHAEEGTPWLEGKHTVFGKVTKGMDVVNAIAAVAVDRTTSRPLTAVTMTSVEVVK